MRAFVAASLALLLPLTTQVQAARAETFARAGLVIESPWLRATLGTLRNTAGFFSVTNQTGETQRLVAVAIEGAAKVELHETRDGTMRAVAFVEIPPGETLAFRPNGWHLMVGPLSDALEEGTTVRGSATFEPGGTLPLEFRVVAPDAREGGNAQH